MATKLPPVFTVRDAMVVVGVDDTDNFDGQSSAWSLAEDLFDNDFTTCMDKLHTDIESDFKSFLILAQAQGKIRTVPRVKKMYQVICPMDERWDQIRKRSFSIYVPSCLYRNSYATL